MMEISMKFIKIFAYDLIEAIQTYCTCRNQENEMRLAIKYKSFILCVGDIIGRNLHADFERTTCVSIINRDTTIQWVIGLTKAVIDNNKEQIDSCGRSLVQIMKGNLDV